MRRVASPYLLGGRTQTHRIEAMHERARRERYLPFQAGN